jgi:hypothetical protein
MGSFLNFLPYAVYPMSQLSEFSDLYSSIYEEDQCLHLPNDAQLFTPESSGSQQAAASVSNSVFVRPQPLPPIPDILQRVGPTKTKGYILYTDMSKEAFVEWWLQTDFGKKKRIHWDGRHQAECWQHFEQIADGKTGRPGVMCKQCSKVLDHPANGHTGTSSMNKHIKGVNCRKSLTKRPNIKQLIENAVRIHSLLNSLRLTYSKPLGPNCPY